MRVFPLIGLLIVVACASQQQPGTTTPGTPNMAAFRGPNKSAAEFVGDHLSCANAAAPTQNYNMYNQCMLVFRSNQMIHLLPIQAEASHGFELNSSESCV
jgi:hypothetical protein